MTKLIGSNPNQAPSNADLGSAAYLDAKEIFLSKGGKLSAFEKIINRQVQSVFVYDTSKDSDGGAWRYRTQGTSWYNDQLNTLTRGPRKEFPSLAVIVTFTNSNGYFAIYDADDPDLPLWFKCTPTGSQMIEAQYKFVHALNGIVTIAAYDERTENSFNFYETRNRVDMFRFVADDIVSAGVENFGGTYYGIVGKITSCNNTTRFASTHYGGSPSVFDLLNRNCTAISMTVEPNAPIDAKTGLPEPTLGVGHLGGLTIVRPNGDGTYASIKRSGAWYNTSGIGGGVQEIIFEDDGTGYWYSNGYYRESSAYPNHGGLYVYSKITDTGTLAGSNNSYGETQSIGTGTGWNKSGFWGAPPTLWVPGSRSANMGVAHMTNGKHFGSEGGLTQISRDYQNFANSLVSHTTNEYATGWFTGTPDIITCADTKIGSVVSSEKLSNNLNGSDTTGWTAVNGSILMSGGVCYLTGSNDINEYLYSSLGELVSGQTYTINFYANSNWSYCRVGTSTGLTTYELLDESVSGGRYYSFSFTADETRTYYIKFGLATNLTTGSISNVYVREGAHNRSISYQGFQIKGSLVTENVASGAELACWTNFSGTNMLSQQNNVDLQYGTGDFSISCWFSSKSVGGGQYLFKRSSNTTARELEVWIAADLKYVAFYTGGSNLNSGNKKYKNNEWVHLVALRRNGIKMIYINGERVASVANTSDVNSSTAATNIGYNCDGATRISLMQVSEYAPTGSQIRKMYREGKELFETNAKATLYGNNSRVTGLAFDSDTKNIHVGTSNGYSIFNGIRRIEHHEEVIGFDISAAKGLVARN